MARHIRKGDTVMVTSGIGRRKGSQAVGKVLRIIHGPTRNQDRVIIEGVNIRKKHAKPSPANQQGGIIQKEMPVHISNVAPVVDGKPTRVRFNIKADGAKVRVATRGGQEIGAQINRVGD